MRLYDTAGNRLYLNAEERAAFLAVARRKPARDRTLCETLLFTGCRPSELLEIAPARVDLSGGTITIRSLKKRKDASGSLKIVYRSVPVPPDYLDTLNTAHGIREAQKTRKQAAKPIWPPRCMMQGKRPTPISSMPPAKRCAAPWPATSKMISDGCIRPIKSPRPISRTQINQANAALPMQHLAC